MMGSTFRYTLHADIPATDIAVLFDAMDGETLALCDLLGDAVLRQQIADGVLSIDVKTSAGRALDGDVEVLSTYLAAPIVVTEVEIAPNAVRAWRVLGRGGEVVRVALDVARDSDGVLEIGGENEEALARNLHAMPRWAQSILAR